MEHYKLGADEVVLYKGDVNLVGQKGQTELILTNHNLIFINTVKKMFFKEEISVMNYSVDSIKMYEGIPQIKANKLHVEIYLVETELEIDFLSKAGLCQFIKEAEKLLTGKTSLEKNAQKVKDTIHLVDDTLGINSVQVVGNTLKNGLVGSVTGLIGKVGKGILGNKKK